jgi:glycyl-tRNA synthetase
LIDTSHRNDIIEAVELKLSRNEDSVTSLVAAPLVGEADSLVAFAGINSSVEQQKKNNNQHLRAFRFDAPRKSGATATTQSAGETQQESKSEEKVIAGSSAALSQASLFRTKNGPGSTDTYQRVTRLSPWPKGKDGVKHTRIGAIATGLAASGEIVLFGVTETPSEKDVIGRIQLGDNEEAEDLDLVSLEHDSERTDDTQGRFLLAYTNGPDVMVGEISSSTRSNSAPEVRCVYTIPLPSSGAPSARPKFRALRFLSPRTLLLLQNAPNRSGSELVLLQLSSAKSSKPQILRRRKLPGTLKIGLGLDICQLGTNPQGQQQTVIAVSGSDNSIPILTIEYGPNRGYSKFRPFTTIRDVHPFSMTKLTFSTFIAPSHPVGPEVGPQNIKLASVSMGNTIVVHTFPLSPFPTSSRTPRYVLAVPGPAEIWELVYSIALLLVSMFAICLSMLAFAEIRGGTPPFLGATEWLPTTIRNTIARDYVVPPREKLTYFDTLLAPRSDIPVAQTFPSASDEKIIESLREILDRVHGSGAAPADIATTAPNSVSVIVRCGEPGHGAEQSVIVETAESSHHESQAQKLQAWTDLSSSEQAAWKQKLIDAGRWTMAEGETVLLGILFSEACGGLGRAVREGLP